MAFASSLRRLPRVVAGVTGLLALSASGCAQDQDFLTVEQAVWFSSSEDCTLTASSEPVISMTADVSFQTRIGMGFMVTNNQSPYAGSNTGIDDSEIAIESAEVRLGFSGGDLADDSFEIALPNDSLLGGESQTFLIQIPSEVSDDLRGRVAPGEFATLELEVVFKARKYGQAGSSKLGEIESRAYSFPLEICNGCLADCTCGTCPTETEFIGVCGFAQGGPVFHPSCPDGMGDTTTDTGG